MMNPRRLRTWLGALAARREVSRPTPAQTWERQYRAGHWDHLNLISETAHYMAIIGYVTHGAVNPDILDVGCGQGRLLALLARFGFGHYLGIDLSRAAIDSATSLGIPAAEFEVADFEAWDTPRRFDIVIFNESLYFAHQPAEMVARSFRWLNDNGLVVVSIYRHGDVRRIWKALDSDPGVRVVDATTVRNLQRQVWDIKALQPTR